MKILCRWRVAPGLVASLVCLCAFAQVPAPGPAQAAAATAAAALQAEAFFKNRDVLDAQLSPSGTQLALTTAAGGKRVALFVVPLGPSGKPARAAAFSDVDVVRFSWVNNNRLVFSVADLESGSGEDRYTAPGLYGVDANGDDLRQLVARRTGPWWWKAAVPAANPWPTTTSCCTSRCPKRGSRTKKSSSAPWCSTGATT
jgi:hypothetical protein